MFKKLFLNLFIEFGPIIGFLIASELTTFIRATTIFVVLTLIALALGLIERGGIAWFPLIVAIIIVTFGLLTIFFHNPFFIIIKDTLYNGIFAVVLFIGLYYRKLFLKILFGGMFAMTNEGWRILTIRWATMFVLLAITNEIARFYLSEYGWVNYKFIATLITVVFSLYQFRLSKKERLPEATAWGMRV
ncbi:MAG: intracellular septation protein [Patescibacteria group bacterium]|nr:intracellular septation protein [Patescibacteria group bacterium]